MALYISFIVSMMYEGLLYTFATYVANVAIRFRSIVSCIFKITDKLFCAADELELLGGPGYEMAKRNLDMMDVLMQEVQEFYENWTKRLDDITNKHEEEQRLQAKQRK